MHINKPIIVVITFYHSFIAKYKFHRCFCRQSTSRLSKYIKNFGIFTKAKYFRPKKTIES